MYDDKCLCGIEGRVFFWGRKKGELMESQELRMGERALWGMPEDQEIPKT